MKRFKHSGALALLLSSALVAPSIALAQAEGEVDEIVVRGQFIPEPLRQTSQVASFLSSEDLARSGDADAAAALTRLSGLSVVRGFVFVRGLGDRYSSALLNGSPLPSPEPLRRQIPLNIFPSNILDGADIQKTYSANLPAEFSGGLIDLRTLRQPPDPFLTVKIGTAGNTESTRRRGLTVDGFDRDWTGIDFGTRDIPGPLRNLIDQNRRVDLSSFSAEELEIASESLVNSELNVLQSQKFNPDLNVELSAGKTYDLGNFDLGLLALVGYESQFRTRRSERIFVPNVVSTASTRLDATTTTWDIVANGFASASLGWGVNNSVTLAGLLIRSTTSFAEVEEGFNVDGVPPDDFVPQGSIEENLIELASLPTNERREASAWYERQIWQASLLGEHRLFDAVDVDWRVAYSRSSREAPYERFAQFIFPGATRTQPGTPSLNQGGQIIRFSELKDEVLSFGGDLEYVLPIAASRDITFSAGFAYSDTERDVELLQFAFDQDRTGAGIALPPEILESRIDFIFSPDNIGPGLLLLRETTNLDDSHTGKLRTIAGYAQADAEILPFVRVTAGVRYETADQDLETLNRFGLTPFAPPVNLSNDYFLPAATVTWNFASDLQLRLGYSQTIARPQFRELAASEFVDPESSRRFQGNPLLTDTRFRNYDARLEYFFGRDRFVTIGGFYKEITDPIEEATNELDGRLRTGYIAAPRAEIYGGEFEFRNRFTMPFELPLIRGAEWLFTTNYTLTFSEVFAGDELIGDPFDAGNLIRASAVFVGSESTDLVGAAKHIVNGQFGYQTENSQFTILANWVSERLARRGVGVPAVFERPGITLDAVFRRNFQVGGNSFVLGLAGRNLLGEETNFFQNSQILGEVPLDRYERGRTFSASITGNF